LYDVLVVADEYIERDRGVSAMPPKSLEFRVSDDHAAVADKPAVVEIVPLRTTFSFGLYFDLTTPIETVGIKSLVTVRDAEADAVCPAAFSTNTVN
jgi:hypothetical protein